MQISIILLTSFLSCGKISGLPDIPRFIFPTNYNTLIASSVPPETPGQNISNQDNASINTMAAIPGMMITNTDIVSSKSDVVHSSEVSLEDEMVRLDNLSDAISTSSEDSNPISQTSLPTNGITVTQISTSTLSSGDASSISTTDGNATTNATEEPLPSFYSTIYNRTLIWLMDTYTLGILIPVAAGILFAAMIIVTVATCSCLRRRCCRQRYRRKSLTEAIKNMKPSDRAKLLAESSEEEL